MRETVGTAPVACDEQVLKLHAARAKPPLLYPCYHACEATVDLLRAQRLVTRIIQNDHPQAQAELSLNLLH